MHSHDDISRSPRHADDFSKAAAHFSPNKSAGLRARLVCDADADECFDTIISRALGGRFARGYRGGRVSRCHNKPFRYLRSLLFNCSVTIYVYAFSCHAPFISAPLAYRIEGRRHHDSF